MRTALLAFIALVLGAATLLSARAERTHAPDAVSTPIAAWNLANCTFNGPDGQMCADVVDLPNGNVAVTIRPCGSGFTPATIVPGDTTRRVASDCYGEFYYVIVPSVNWSDVTNCGQLNWSYDHCL